MNTPLITIAVDGFSSCGKSTMAKQLARSVGYIYIDSGAMYRTVALYALQQGWITADQLDEAALALALEQGELQVSFQKNSTTQLPETYLNGVLVEEAIRTMEVSNLVSRVSALSFVRSAMVRQQQQLGSAKGIVMDGRDIGTVVFPTAELKVFVTASAQTRAQRRVDELQAKGVAVSFDEVLHNIEMRDHLDQTRADSPLVKAEDAVLLDNSTLTIEEQNTWLHRLYCERIAAVQI